MSVDYALPGEVTLAQAPTLAREALHALTGRPAPWRIDVSGLQRFDSSCLALLMELRRHAGAAGIELSAVPARLLSLARAYGVDFVLGAGLQAHGAQTGEPAPR